MSEPPPDFLELATQALSQHNFYEGLKYIGLLQGSEQQPDAGLLQGSDQQPDAGALLQGSDQQPTASAKLLAIVNPIVATAQITKFETPNWYAILNLPIFCENPHEITKAYQDLYNHLNPNQNEFPCAQIALRICKLAFSVLSDCNRKDLFDLDLDETVNPKTLQFKNLDGGRIKALLKNQPPPPPGKLPNADDDDDDDDKFGVWLMCNSCNEKFKKLDLQEFTKCKFCGWDFNTGEAVNTNRRQNKYELTIRNAFPLVGNAGKDGSLFVRCQRCPRVLHEADDSSIGLCRRCKHVADSEWVKSCLNIQGNEDGNVVLGLEGLKAMGQEEENVENANVVVDDEDVWITCQGCKVNINNPDLQEVYKCQCGMEFNICDAMELYDRNKRKPQK